MSVEYENGDGAVWLRLNRPEKLNALCLGEWQNLTKGLRRAADESMNPVILTGTGRAFCAGDDIEVFAPLIADRDAADNFFLDGLYGAFEAIVMHPAPVIAAVNGSAFGGGLEIVAMCDLAVAAEDAKFGLPEGKLGAMAAVFVALATTHLAFKAANAFTYRMASYDAREALQLGIVNEVVPQTEVERTANRMARDINSASPESVFWTKQFLTSQAREVTLPRIRAALRTSIDELLCTTNLVEGTKAFLDKRVPHFVGR